MRVYLQMLDKLNFSQGYSTVSNNLIIAQHFGHLVFIRLCMIGNFLIH